MMNNLFSTINIQSKRASQGFTLIELVVVLVVSGILAVGTVAFISRTVESLDATSTRNQLASAGRTAIDRMSLELHNALPNSIRVSGSCLEFIPVRAATTYIDPAFTNPGTSTFDVVNFVEKNVPVYPDAALLPAPTLGGTPNLRPLYAVVYPRNRNRVYDGDNNTAAIPPEFNNRRPVQTINSIVVNGSDSNLATITLAEAHRFQRRSPQERFFVTELPVSFCVVGSNLYRYTNYGFHQTQTTQEESGSCDASTANRCLPNYGNHALLPDKKLIVDSITSSTFSVGNQNLARNSLVSIQFDMASGNDTITLRSEILTRSVP